MATRKDLPGLQVFEMGGNGSGDWVAKILVGPGRYVRRKLFSKQGDVRASKRTSAEAWRRAEDIYHDLTGNQATADNPTLRAVFEAAATESGRSRLPGGPSPQTVTNRRRVFDRFLEHVSSWPVGKDRRRTFGDHGLARDVSSRMVDAYLERRRGKVKPATVQREAEALRRAFYFAASRWPALAEWETRNPARRPRSAASADAEQTEIKAKAYTEAEVRRLLRFARGGWTRDVRGVRNNGESVIWEQPVKVSAYVADLIELIWETGFRPGDAFALQWGDVDFEKHLALAKTKGPRRWVPLSPRAEELLKARRRGAENVWVFGRKLDRRNAERALKSVCEAASVPYKRAFYGLRHGFACHALETGSLAIHQLSAVLGHSDLKTTSIYAQAKVEAFVEEYRARKRGGNDDVSRGPRAGGA